MSAQPLSDKQIRFCDEYLISFNATKAAIAAGYSKKTARAQGSRLLTVVDIQNYLQSKKQKTLQKLEISKDRVMLELSRVALQDIRQFYDEDGNLIPIHLLDDDAAAVLSGMEEEEIYDIVKGKKKQVGVLRKIKRWDKLKAIEMLAKHYGILKEVPPVVNNYNLSSLSPAELKHLLAIKKKTVNG